MKYQDVILYIEKEINEGRLVAGSKLPSIRILAHDLACSKSTIAKAYEVLVDHKLAYVIDKTGFYLMQDPEHRLISKQIDLGLNKAYQLLDKRDIRIMINNGLNDYDSFNQDIEGYHPLRVNLRRYFKMRKMFASVHDTIMIPSLNQAVMATTSLSLFDNILIENPTDKAVAEQVRKKKNIFTFDRLNLDWDLIELKIKQEKIKLLLITPHVHIPTTHSLDLEEKQRLLNICQRHGVYILEINHYEDLFDYPESQSLFALDKHELVIHVKTFNHVFSSLIEDVVLISPKRISDPIKLFKRKYIGQDSIFNQLLLNEILKEYDIKPNIKLFSSKFAIIESYLKTLPFTVRYADTHNFAFIEVPFHYNLETILVELEHKNIYLESIKEYFVNSHGIKGILIAVNDIDNNLLHDTLQMIVEKFAL